MPQLSPDVELAAAVAGELTMPCLLGSSASVPRVHDYFGAWLMEPIACLSLFEHASKLDMATHLQGYKHEPHSIVTYLDRSGTAREEAVADSVAVIDLVGVMMKAETSLGASASTIRVRQELRRAANDTRVSAIILRIDSPGGSVSGTSDLADTVAWATKIKPVVAFGEDLVASAAMWVAAQCSSFVVNSRTASVGSIGTIIGLYDLSGKAAAEGIKAKVYATGPLKGAGFAGSAITPEQDAYFQNIVDATQEHFSNAVAAGRELTREQVDELATGGVFSAEVALAAGLIDGIQSFEQTLQQLWSVKSPKGLSPMPTERQQFTHDLTQYMEHFGAENGAKWFAEQIDLATAYERQCVELRAGSLELATEADARVTALQATHAAAVQTLTTQIADLEARLKAVKLGETEPASFSDGETKTVKGLGSLVKLRN